MKLLIREVRQKKGVSLSWLAAQSGLSVSYLSELESAPNKAKNPSLKTICKIARALNVDPTKLYECEGDENDTNLYR